MTMQPKDNTGKTKGNCCQYFEQQWPIVCATARLVFIIYYNFFYKKH